MPCGWEHQDLLEYVNKLCENFNEEEQWIRDELIDISGLNEINYWQGLNLSQPKKGVKGSWKAFKKMENDRIRVIHNIFIEKGLESPFEEGGRLSSGLRKTKHNPDRKKGGKKKKGGRRRT